MPTPLTASRQVRALMMRWRGGARYANTRKRPGQPLRNQVDVFRSCDNTGPARVMAPQHPAIDLAFAVRGAIRIGLLVEPKAPNRRHHGVPGTHSIREARY